MANNEKLLGNGAQKDQLVELTLQTLNVIILLLDPATSKNSFMFACVIIFVSLRQVPY